MMQPTNIAGFAPIAGALHAFHACAPVQVQLLMCSALHAQARFQQLIAD